MKVKHFVVLSFVFASQLVHADPCKEGTIFHELSEGRNNGYFGKCDLEIHACEKKGKDPLWLGDVLIKHRNGKTLYIPLYSPESKFSNTLITTQSKPGVVSYLYKDRNYDPVSGLKEMYQINYITSKGRWKFEFIMNSSRESRKNPIRSLLFHDVKIICEE